jgi:3-oxoacyl-[acyl-carrier-protein] synthase III
MASSSANVLGQPVSMGRSTIVAGIGHYVPENEVTNVELSKTIDTSDSWIAERTGIRARRVAPEGMTTSFLAVEASKNALQNANMQPSEIDLIIAATLSPDYFFPGIGGIVQHKLGVPLVGAIDIRVQCSGFVHGLAMADAFIKSGQAKTVLLVCAEIQTTIMDMTTRGRDMGVLFGDGAASLILKAHEWKNADSVPLAQGNERGVIDNIMGGDGGGAEMLIMRAPGTSQKKFITNEDLEEGRRWPHMEGKTVFKHAITRMCESADTLLKRNGIQASDLSLVVPHQANLRISEMVREKMGLPPEKVFNNIHKYGNTTAATIPLCLSEAVQEGRLKKGDLIMTVAFGAGFTWGANLIRW